MSPKKIYSNPYPYAGECELTWKRGLGRCNEDVNYDEDITAGRAALISMWLCLFKKGRRGIEGHTEGRQREHTGEQRQRLEW